MKKLLILNNNAFFFEGEKILVYKQTGELFQDLTKQFDLEAFHFIIEKEENDSLADFNLKLLPMDVFSVKHRNNKVINYLNAYFILFQRILKSDFVYFFYPTSFFLGAIFSYIFNKPFGLYVRGEKGIGSSVSRFIFKKAKFVLTVSPRFTALIKEYNLSTYTIKPMISFSLSDFEVKSKQSRKNDFSILFVGRIEYDKGVFELLEAFEGLILDGVENIKLNLVGDGKSLSEIKKLIGEKQLEDKIHVLGPIYDKDELKDIYLDNDLFILPTHHEGFPRVLYEAMIFDLPIVTTFVGSISNLMKDQYNCLEISVNNKDDIKEKLKHLILRSDLREELAKNGKETIKEYISNNSVSHSDLIIKLFNNG